VYHTVPFVTATGHKDIFSLSLFVVRRMKRMMTQAVSVRRRPQVSYLTTPILSHFFHKSTQYLVEPRTARKMVPVPISVADLVPGSGAFLTPVSVIREM
jgi:hypothetical protein